MLTPLHQFINLTEDVELPDSNRRSKRHEVVARLYFLLSKLSEEQRITLLKLLLRDRSVDHLFKLIIDLTDNQRLVLMKQLEQITSKPSRHDRRKHLRTDCLINAKISVANKILPCFILDLSPYGAFVDTSEGISAGQTARLMFSSPNSRERLILSAVVAWSEDQGIGLKFTYLTPRQLDVLKAFAENSQKVYEINSC